MVWFDLTRFSPLKTAIGIYNFFYLFQFVCVHCPIFSLLYLFFSHFNLNLNNYVIIRNRYDYYNLQGSKIYYDVPEVYPFSVY